MPYPRAVRDYERERLAPSRAIQEAHLRLIERTLQALAGEEVTVEITLRPLPDPSPASGSAEHWRREGGQ